MGGKNVIFIMMDSLQFNYLGCYGNPWIETPNMDKLAREGTLFENAYAEGLPTIPVRRAMMTGRFSLPFKGWGALDPDDTTIADICWGRGIHTALIYDTAPMQLPKYGFSRGFNDVIFKHGHELDHYFYAGDPLYHLDPNDYVEHSSIYDSDGNYRNEHATLTLPELEAYLKLRQHWRGEESSYIGTLTSAALSWLDNVDKAKPFLLWFDSFDPHEPWDPPSVWEKDKKCPYDPDYKGKDEILPLLGDIDDIYTEEQLHHIRMLYAENVTLCDKWIGKLLNKVRDLGLWDDTLIILTSDHGEPMGHGEHGHGIMRKCRPWPYEELAHIPLIVRMPNQGAGRRVTGFVQSCDIAPTIADYLDIYEKEKVSYGGSHLANCGTDDFQGMSLIPCCTGERDGNYPHAIAGYYGFSWSIITNEYSFIHWVGGLNEPPEVVAAMYSDGGGSMGGAYYKSLQSDEMWTCTPGSEVIVPETDQLFDRKKDPFQLNNIIKDYPEIAKRLLQELKEYIGMLRTT